MKIKKGDNVMIMKGKDRGKSGKITSVNPTKNRALIHGLNQVKKSMRPKKQGEKGQIISVSLPISLNNVRIICSSCGSPSRVGFSITGDKKIRICKKCKGTFL